MVNNINEVRTHQFGNYIYNYYHHFPSEVSLEGKRLIANYRTYLFVIVILPIVLTALSSREIFIQTSDFLHITKDSFALNVFGFAVVYLLYAILCGFLYWIYYRFITKYRSITIKDGYLIYGGMRISLDKVFYCYADKKRAIIYTEGKDKFFVDKYLFSNEAEAYALCLAIRKFKETIG